MGAGDTCTVYAATYTENVTVTAGTSGNYKTITVNGTDIVNVSGGFTLNSHTKLAGNCAAAVAITGFTGTSGTLTFSASNSFSAGNTIALHGFTSPNTGLNGQTVTILSTGLTGSVFEATVTGSGYSSGIGAGSVTVGSCGFSITQPSQSGGCASIVDGSTDVYITNNSLSQCGLGNDVEVTMGSTNGSSYVYITGNTFSYGCGTSSAPNNCVAISNSGNHIFEQNNDFSHFGIVIEAYGQYEVIRNNTFHDIYESECGSASGNCHMDMIYAERSNTAANYVVQYQLWEGNTATNIVGADGKGLWTAADNPGGCGTSCFNVIGRYNVFSHFGSATSSQTSGFLNVKYYNNTWVDPNNAANCGGGGASTSYRDDTSSGGAEINNLFYYTAYPTSQSCGWYAYSLNASGDNTGFTAGANLAYCQNGTGCGIQTLTQGASYLFASDPNTFVSNTLDSTDPLAGYSVGNFNLTAGSAALNAGTYLTKVGTGDAGTGTTLTVTDTAFFQDGLGLNAAGVQADCIKVTSTSNSSVCITAVNYTGGTVTLASSISRSVGDEIWLYSKSDGTVELTGSAPNIGALGASQSFSCTPGTIPATHSGHISLTCTGVGTAWTGSTAFSASGACTYVSTSNSSSTSQTVVVTTGSAGTCTITDTTDSLSTTVGVDAASLSISPTSGNKSTTPTITLTGVNTLWSSETASGLFSVSGGSCSGESIGTPTVSSNTSATATLTTGSAACTITVEDTSTTATASFTVTNSGSSTSAPAAWIF
jgi:hypothetical protein